MEFSTPTTKQEMYDTLKDIFYFYRIQRQTYERIDLLPLELEKLTFTPLTSEELRQKAIVYLDGAQKREVLKLKEEINQKISALNSKIASTESAYLIALDNINLRFNESEEKIQVEAARKGLSNSSVVLDKITQLETAKNEQIQRLEGQKMDKITQYNSEISSLNTALSGADGYFSEIFACELLAKTEELTAQQCEFLANIVKYNNNVDEKIVKHQNDIIKTDANLAFKYAELNGEFMSKEQLIEMGYYNDVITCITAYYNTLTPLIAYDDIKSEGKLAIYLDDYYPNVVYLYRTRAES